MKVIKEGEKMDTKPKKCMKYQNGCSSIPNKLRKHNVGEWEGLTCDQALCNTLCGWAHIHKKNKD